MKPTILQKFHRDHSGAIALMLLAGALILMMMAWVVYDAGDASRQKIKTQAAADFSAASQAAVKARSMNMMAYSNVAKRSIFAIHTTYIANFVAYIKWAGILKSAGEFLMDIGLRDIGQELASAGDIWITWWMDEARGDFRSFSGMDILDKEDLDDPDDFIINITREILEVIADPAQAQNFGMRVSVDTLAQHALPVSDGNWSGYSLRYHAQDIRALDNYQRYLAGVTPWWAWSEQLVRGLRNGVTATGSFPLPMEFDQGLNTLVNQILAGDDEPSEIIDTLPVRPGDIDDFDGAGADEIGGRVNMAKSIKKQLDGADAIGLISDLVNGGTPDFENMTDTVFFVEHLVNILGAVLPSDYPEIDFRLNQDYSSPNEWGIDNVLGAAVVAALQDVVFATLVGVSTHNIFVNSALDFTQKLFDQQLGTASASPWLLLRYPSEAQWLLKSSNIVLSYKSRPKLFGQDQQKFDVPANEYEHVDPVTGLGGLLGSLGDSVYRNSGMWGLARAEVYYNAEGQPDLWNPVWNSRLRPVALENEFAQADYSLGLAYREMALSMAMMGSLMISDFDIAQVAGDFIQMSRNMRAMGPSTSAGLSK